MVTIPDSLFVELMNGDISTNDIVNKARCSKSSVYSKKQDFLKRWNHDSGKLLCLNCTLHHRCGIDSKQGNRPLSSMARCTYKRFHKINELPTNAIIVHINGIMNDNRPSNLYMLPCKEIASSYIRYRAENGGNVHPHEYMKIRGNYLMETLFNNEWLYQKYVIEGLSMKDISSCFDLPLSTLSKTINRYKSPNNPDMKIIECRPKYKNGSSAKKIINNLL